MLLEIVSVIGLIGSAAALVAATGGLALFYTVFIDKERGPRLGYFLSSMDRNYVVNRIKKPYPAGHSRIKRYSRHPK